MCGIGGIYTPSGASFPVGEVRALWDALEDRGTHASGVSFKWVGADLPIIKKSAVRASKNSHTLKMCKGVNTRYAFFHTRYTTQGSTSYNGNNHPIVSQDIILTHNGVLRNDNQVFASTGINRQHKVDSEAINAGLRFGGVEWVAENILGSMSIAWTDITQNHDIVNLFTNGGNPLVIARVNGHQIAWASSLEHLEFAGFKVEAHFNAAPFKHYQISRSSEGSVVVSSTWVSDKVVEAKVSGMYRHSSSYGQQTGYDSIGTKKPRKSFKSSSIGNSEMKAQMSGQKVVLNGMEYDPNTQTWKNWNGA